MLQNKFLFNQSSVSLEINGLPDHSNDEKKDNISIISQWKLMIIGKPVIEGNIDHLKTMMRAFYSYSISIINEENAFFESNLIDIKPENSNSHILLLKSSKPDIKPLNIKIGNSVLADIVNCFDQLGSSKKIKNIYSKDFKSLNNNNFLLDKKNVTNFILPPIISLCSIFLVSSAFIFFYNGNEKNEKSLLLNSTNKLVSIKSIIKLL